MPDTAATNASRRPTPRETVKALAAMDRPSASDGERAAAEWIAARLDELGCGVSVDEERAFESYARPLAALSALGALAGVAALTRRGRLAGALVAGAAAAGIADDISNGPRLFRRAPMRRKPTWNVVAESGDRSAERTIVLLAHHDAARTGAIFDQTGQRWAAERAPGSSSASTRRCRSGGRWSDHPRWWRGAPRADVRDWWPRD